MLWSGFTKGRSGRRGIPHSGGLTSAQRHHIVVRRLWRGQLRRRRGPTGFVIPLPEGGLGAHSGLTEGGPAFRRVFQNGGLGRDHLRVGEVGHAGGRWRDDLQRSFRLPLTEGLGLPSGFAVRATAWAVARGTSGGGSAGDSTTGCSVSSVSLSRRASASAQASHRAVPDSAADSRASDWAATESGTGSSGGSAASVTVSSAGGRGAPWARMAKTLRQG